MIKKNLLIALSLLAIWTLSAQTYFGDQNIIIQSVTEGAYSVYACDIDGDGDQDILSAFTEGIIAWYENTDGNGIFGAKRVITDSADGAKSVITYDMDGDGDQDVLSASSIDDKIAWYENTDGNGTFGAQQVITDSADGACSVYVTDIDGDGDPDVLSASYSDKLSWYENTDGKGTFGIHHTITSSAASTCSVFACDIDGDGDPDVLSASTDDKIDWYENTDGKGTYGAPHVITTAIYGARSVYACDIDGDGDTDVLSASGDDSKVAWYENMDGNGTFGAQQIISTAFYLTDSVYACDLDGDGDHDVLSAAYDGIIAWFENADGNGSFSAPQVITTSANGARSVYACDLDGDGDTDVLSASYADDKIAWYENMDGNGSFGVPQVLTPSVHGARSVYACDIDGDGDADVLSASYTDAIIAWYKNTDGNGTFDAQQVITSEATRAESVYACDIDGDGDMDVLSALYRSKDDLAWYENTEGNGTFGAPQVIPSTDYGSSVYACDIDGDGDLDVLSAFILDDIIAWYENTDGNGSFSAEQVITTAADGAKSVYACDIDGDGDMDVLSASYIDDKIAWYKNIDGHGTFGGQQVITNSVNVAESVYASDIDGDGDMDVLSASGYDDKIAWYENINGQGAFSAEQIITTVADGAQSVYACDIDGDGDTDVLSASSMDAKIAWYENIDGNGTFGTQQVITTSADGAQSVYACDMDGDGDIDVLSASSTFTDSRLAWYENFTIEIVTQPTDVTSCPGSDAEFSVTADGAEMFQWQGDEGAGYANLSDNAVYSGVTSHTLTISNADTVMNGYSYRCLLNPEGSIVSDVAVLTFDNLSPEITSTHVDLILNAGSECEAVLPDYTGEVTATDNCDTELNIAQNPIAGTSISGQTNTVTLTVSDDMGNTDEVIFNIAIEDNTTPTISCAGNQTVVAGETHYYTVSGTEFDPAETGDNCGVAVVENDFTNTATLAGAQIPEGANTITWTITDHAGNENTCSFDITVTAFSDGVEKLQQKGISIYPNPTTGIVNFEFTDTHIQQINISDITGNQIVEKTQIQQSETLDLSGFESGIYVISIQTDKEILTIKIVKE
jgi:hypothetical protein